MAHSTAHSSTAHPSVFQFTGLSTLLLAVAGIFALTACETSGKSVRDAAGPAATAATETGKQAAVSYRFIDARQAGAILAREDEYTAELQPTEIGIKNQDPARTALSDLQANYRTGTLEWTAGERAAVQLAMESLRPALAPYDRHLPREVLLAKISDRVEGGLPHTRANMILFSQSALDGLISRKDDGLRSLFLHELHHVLSRHNADRHDDYYALIGYRPCAFTEPAPLRAMRLTNPDAATYRHYAPVPVNRDGIVADGVIPYLSVSGPYQQNSNTTLGNYFSFGLLAVTVSDGTCSVAGDAPTLIAPPDLPAFLKLIGGNTGYIIHPEETLADNFSYLILGRQNLPDPQIPQAIRAFWAAE